MTKGHRYGVLLVDPPWAFGDRLANGRRGAAHKYQVMELRKICEMKPTIDRFAADDCAVFIWCPSSLVVVGYLGIVMSRWELQPKTEAFRWVKTTKHGGAPAMGMGHWTRQNSEGCYLGVRGKPKVVSHSVRQVVMAPRREHSRKPDEIYGLIEQLMGDVPRIELFARQRWPGWDAWGNQTRKFKPQLAAGR